MGSMIGSLAAHTLRNLCRSKQLVTQRCFSISSMASSQIFRQLFEKESSTYTYLLGDSESKEAVLIDPVIETAERDVKMVKELAPGCEPVLSENSGGKADLLVKEGNCIKFGNQCLEVVETPGHTAGCITYIDRSNGRAFTGDALLIRGCGRTDFQGGSASTLYKSVWSKILSLPENFSLYPAHDYKGCMKTSVAEEKQFNPRLTKNEEEFINIMAGLNLAYPKKIDESLPANMVCGLYELPERMKDWV